MSGTNVHSKKENKYSACSKIIPTTPEKGLEIPPETSKPSPTIKQVKSESLGLDISPASECEIKENGEVFDKSGKKIGEISIEEMNEARQIRKQRAPSRDKAKVKANSENGEMDK